MPQLGSTWFMGATVVPDCDLIISGVAEAFDGGTFYIDHASEALSMLQTFSSLISCDYYWDESGRIHLTNHPSIGWEGSILRDYFGFTGNLFAAADSQAPNHSPLWFSGGVAATKETNSQALGWTDEEVVVIASPNMRRQTAINYDAGSPKIIEGFSYDYVPMNRLWTGADGEPGQFKVFREYVLIRYANFFAYYNVYEDSESDDETNIVLANGLGPYKLNGDASMTKWLRRKVKNAELAGSINFDVALADEIE